MSSNPGGGPSWYNPDSSWSCARCGLRNEVTLIWCARCGLGAPPPPGWYNQGPPPGSPPGYFEGPPAPYQVPPESPSRDPMSYGVAAYPPATGEPRRRRSTRARLGLFAIMGVILAVLIIPSTLAYLAAYQIVVRPDFPVSVSGVTVTYYDITGASAADLVDAMHTRGATTCHTTDAIACLSYGFDWTVRTGTTNAGRCTVSTVNLKSTYEMTLPRWTGPARVPAGLVAWWRQVQAHLIWHESQHLNISRDYEPKIKAAIAAGPCADSTDAPAPGVLTVKAALAADQNQFDASDRGWTWPAYVGP